MSEIWNDEYEARRGDVSLYIYRKRVGAPRDGEAPKPVLVLVHGSSFAGRGGFDLEVPGHDDYSLMDRFARYGYDVFAPDHEGYGRSSRTDGNSDIACGVEDLRAVAPVIASVTGQDGFHFYGSSSGALRAAAFAAAEPARVLRLVLDAFVWTGEGAPTLKKRSERLAEWRDNAHRKTDRAFFHSIFNRDKPGTSDPAVADALADAELALGDTVPNGTYLDMCANLPVVDPTAVTCPVQIIRAEFDGIATEEDLLAFFARLPNKDKQFCLLPGLAHVAYLGVNRDRFWHVMHAFLDMPRRRDR